MSQPYLSVVIPAFNEAAGIAGTLDAVVADLDTLGHPFEVIVVDDGSADETAARVAACAAVEPRIRLIRAGHSGKGGAVRRGMLEARGDWRFLADADLSMPIAQVRRFLPSGADPHPDILIGSRETAGAERVAEPWHRHLLGRLFNRMARLLVIDGIQDTQCGYKLFSAAAAEALFPLQTLDGFGFDVEVLFLARRAGFTLREVPVTWTYRTRTTVTAWSGAAGFVDLLTVRWNQMRGRYRQARAVRGQASQEKS